MPLPLPDTHRSAPATGDALARHAAEVRAATLRLAEPLSDEDCQVQSMADASPVKWHLAHTSWFFETFVLERFEPGFQPFDANFRVLFNSYYQGVGERAQRAQRGLVSRPSLAEVKRYRAAVDERLQAVLARRADDAALREIVTLGLHHEQQHQELLVTDLKHALGISAAHGAAVAYAPRRPLASVASVASAGAAVPAALPAWFGFDGGLVDVGHDAEQDGRFAFDNETPRHRQHLAPFELASQPLSNADVLAFIADAGYRRPELWLSLGWDWVCAGARSAPLYWQQRDGRWWVHTLHGTAPVDLCAPACHLSHFEADALARWSGARLPTEAEWEVAARQATQAAWAQAHFADRGLFHPTHPPAAPHAASEPQQLFGDVWEWTQSSYSAYPGYRPAAGAVGEYNGKFMCQQLVLRGGSCATPAGHVRASYRNFFPPEAQWQFSGVRLARDA